MKEKIKKYLFALIIIPNLFRFDVSQLTSDNYLPLNKNNYLVQSFIPQNNNLYNISFYVNKKNLNIDTPFFFKLYEGSMGTVPVAQINFTARNIGSNFWLKLTFPKIVDSKGKKYFVKIEAPFYQGKDIDFGYSNIDLVKDAQGYINNTKIVGDFAFRTSYKATPKEYLLDILHSFENRINLDRPFFLFYSLLLSGVLVFSMFLAYKKK